MRKGKRKFFPANHSGIRNTNKRRCLELRKGGSAILITSGSVGGVKNAINESLSFLRNYSHEHNKNGNAVIDNVEDSVSAELKNLKEDNQNFFFHSNVAKGIGIIECPKAEANAIVYKVVKSLVDETKEGSMRPELSCRFLNRLLPMDVICSPHLTSFYHAAAFLIRKYFPNSTAAKYSDNELITSTFFENSKKVLSEKEVTDAADDPEKNKIQQTVGEDTVAEQKQGLQEEKSQKDDKIDEENEAQRKNKVLIESKVAEDDKTAEEIKSNETNNDKAIWRKTELNPWFIVPDEATWAVEFQKRGGIKTLERDSVTDLIASYVGKSYKVNLSQPDFTVFVEVNPVFCGISVLKNYVRLFKYNIHRICHKFEDGNQ